MRFNIRVYGCIIKNNNLLALQEQYAGETMLKLPGGGLEFGEGTIECLRRELREELNISLQSAEHFYTQESFLVSKFNPKDQLLTIYYLAQVDHLNDMYIKDTNIDKIKWISLQKTAKNPFNLPIDRLVFEKLKEIF